MEKNLPQNLKSKIYLKVYTDKNHLLGLKGFLHRKLTFDMLWSIKKYEEIYYTLWCINAPNKSY